MKKLIIAVAAIFIASGAQSQSSGKKVVFGAKAGVNFPSIKVKFDGGSVKGDGITGFHIGGFAEIGAAENIAVQPELLFSQIGGKAANGNTKTTLGYINIPLLVKYKVSNFGIYLGPQLGFLASAKLKFAGQTRDAREDIKSTEFSGVLGAEYNLPQGIGFNARYAAGLSSIAKEKSYKEKHSVFQVGVHYTFL